jgi:hypothetical protein
MAKTLVNVWRGISMMGHWEMTSSHRHDGPLSEHNRAVCQGWSKNITFESLIRVRCMRYLPKQPKRYSLVKATINQRRALLEIRHEVFVRVTFRQVVDDHSRVRL